MTIISILRMSAICGSETEEAFSNYGITSDVYSCCVIDFEPMLKFLF